MAAPGYFKFKGRVPDDDLLHQVVPDDVAARIGPPPTSVHIPGVGYVPKYGPTVTGTSVAYDPANDCQGCFTSCRCQIHNNCYNYAVNIATNSFAHPGRAHGLPDFTGAIDGERIVEGAKLDGLKWVGGIGTTIAYLREQAPLLGSGHFVALVIAAADTDAGFDGDFHWVRCDNLDLDPSSWSQKDGPDQMTNFDFAGAPIYDPSQANWTVNGGPSNPGEPDLIVTYDFVGYMFVPREGVTII